MEIRKKWWEGKVWKKIDANWCIIPLKNSYRNDLGDVVLFRSVFIFKSA